MSLNTIEELIEDMRLGRMVILMDDEDRENEGDIVMAAQHVRPEDINFMAKNARGLICLTLTPERCEQLQLQLMVNKNGTQLGTNFTASIEAATGVTTGISAHDRARTVQVAVARDAKSDDIVQPGHVFPLRAQPGGVLHRAGHTEAGCDLARLAGLEPASVIVEIMNEDGTMARRPDLEKFTAEHGLRMGTIADLIHYRIRHEKTVTRISEDKLPTEHGEFRQITYRDTLDGAIHLALVKGDPSKVDAALVRVHVLNPLRDAMGAVKEGRLGWSLPRVLKRMASEPAGVVVLLAQSFDALDIAQTLDQFHSGRRAQQRMAPDGTGIYRTTGTGSQILRDLGVRKMRLLSSPMRFNALSGFDLEIIETIDSDQ